MTKPRDRSSLILPGLGLKRNWGVWTATHLPLNLTPTVCARLVQFIGSLTANEEVLPVQSPAWVMAWTLGDLLAPHCPWTGTLSRWSSLSTFLSGDLKELTLLEKSRVIPVWSRVELWATFFRHTVRGQGRQAIGPVSRRSIDGLKRTHTSWKYGNPGLVEGWTFGDLLLPHRPWTGTSSRWSSLSTFYCGTWKNPRTSWKE